MEIIGSIILSVVQSILFFNKEIGISMLLFLLIGNSIIYYILFRKKKIQNKNGIFLMIPIILLSSTYLIFANEAFYNVNILAIFILNLIMYAIVTHKKDYFKNHLFNTGKIVIDTIEGMEDGVNATKEKVVECIGKKRKIEKEKIKKVLKSMLVVFSVVGIVILLLSSADSIFASLFSGMGKIFTVIKIDSTFSLVARIAIIAILYFIFLSFFFVIQKETTTRIEGKVREKNTENTFTIKLLLIMLNIVYFVFCYIQIKSLFAKINISGTFNYATYARTGFFQLMFVSVINFVIILISNRYREGKEKVIKFLDLLLIVFTTIIAMSSMYRMHMYELEFGLTYLRIFVYIILFAELASFVPVIIYIFNQKFDFMKWCFVILLSVYCITNYMNLEKIIIYKNLNKQTSKEAVDYSYISEIASADSYDILEEKLKSDEKITSSEKLEILDILLNLASRREALSWQEFNISKYKINEKNIDTEKIEQEIENTKEKIQEEKKVNEIVSEQSGKNIYREKINGEEYLVKEVDKVMGTAAWNIYKLTDEGSNYSIINTIEVTTPSKIKFFENGLGFLERPTNIYCGKDDLLITYDSGKTFEKITFPSGEFTLSDPEGEKWENCYDYFYLPTQDEKGNLIVLASGGYEGGYNEGKTRAKYISTDKGKTWNFVEEIWK